VVCPRRECERKTAKAAPVKWTTDKPTKPGWYWWRNRSKSNASALVEITIDEHGLLKSGPPAYFAEGSLVDTPGEEWAERIEPS
jgi:hypothetical protein